MRFIKAGAGALGQCMMSVEKGKVAEAKRGQVHRIGAMAEHAESSDQ